METKPDIRKIRVGLQKVRDIYALRRGFTDILEEKISSELDKALGTVSGQLEASFIDEEVKSEPIDAPWLIKLTKAIADASIYRQIDDQFADFVSEYSMVVSAWNDRVVRSSELTRELAVAESLAVSRPAMIQAAKALRALSEKLIQLNFIETPALNMSKFYLDSLRKNLEKKEEKE
ncbi:MAG: hypothetical protein PHG66_03075 [Candidatus Colwellbacteria bacterium]|nr:hypothetical protein [Candidatus Colwellbacteria bacterium]